MRGLAEFIMRGRLQAAAVAVFGSLLPLISPATVGLLSLRRGLSEGILVTLWALLPLLYVYYTSDINPVVVLSSIVALVIMPAAAEVLKVSIAWRHTLVFISVASGLLAVLLGVLFAAEVGNTQQLLTGVFASMQQNPTARAFEPNAFFTQGLVGYIVALQVILSLLLARWWQALLYNPGGFQAEFHQLRLSVRQAAVLLTAVAFCQFASPQYFSWGALLGLPLMLSGIALVHYFITSRGMGLHWLVLFYIGLVTVSPLSLVLVLFGFIDSIVNFRSRMAGKSGQ